MSDMYQKQNEAPDQGVYICPECGCQMVFEDDGLLICPECGISMNVREFDSKSGQD